jgi:hypothetical protein
MVAAGALEKDNLPVLGVARTGIVRLHLGGSKGARAGFGNKELQAALGARRHLQWFLCVHALVSLSFSSISGVPGGTSAQILPECGRAWRIHAALATGSGHRLCGGNGSGPSGDAGRAPVWWRDPAGAWGS